MKYFLIILGIVSLTLSDTLVAMNSPNQTEEISAKIGNQHIIKTYDIANLDQDINTPIDLDIALPENGIQQRSKEKEWKKENFVSFVRFLENKDTQKAANLYQKLGLAIDPFAIGGHGASAMGPVAVKALANGIVSLRFGGNGTFVNVRLDYIFMKNGIMYQINSRGLGLYFFANSSNSILDDEKNLEVVFYCEKDTFMLDSLSIKGVKKAGCKILSSAYNTRNSIGPGIQYLKRLLQKPNRNRAFEKNYNQFISDMTKIWK